MYTKKDSGVVHGVNDSATFQICRSRPGWTILPPESRFFFVCFHCRRYTVYVLPHNIFSFILEFLPFIPPRPFFFFQFIFIFKKKKENNFQNVKKKVDGNSRFFRSGDPFLCLRIHFLLPKMKYSIKLSSPKKIK